MIQSGFQAERSVIAPNGRMITMLMNKGMEEGAAWIGEHENRTYKENADGATAVVISERRQGVHVVNGSRYYIDETREVQQSGKTTRGGAWTATIENTTYRCNARGEWTASAEQRNAVRKDAANRERIVQMSRDLLHQGRAGGNLSPWTYTLDGKVYRQVADVTITTGGYSFTIGDQFQQVAENKYAVFHNEIVQMSRDATKAGSVWTFTTNDGRTFQGPEGKFEHVSSQHFAVVDNEITSVTTDAKHPHAPQTAANARGDTYQEINGVFEKVRETEGVYTVLENGQIALMGYDPRVANSERVSSTTDALGNMWTRKQDKIEMTWEAQNHYTLTDTGQRILFGHDPRVQNGDRVLTGQDQDGNTWNMVDGKMTEKLHLANEYEQTADGQWVRLGWDPNVENASHSASGVDQRGNTWTMVNGKLVQKLQLDNKYTETEDGQWVRLGWDPTVGNAERVSSGVDQDGNTWTMVAGTLTKKMELDNKYTETGDGQWVRLSWDPTVEGSKNTASGTDQDGNTWTMVAGVLTKKLQLDNKYTRTRTGQWVRLGWDPTVGNSRRVSSGTDQNGNTWTLVGSRLVMKFRLSNTYTRTSRGQWVRLGWDPTVKDSHKAASGTDQDGNTWTLADGSLKETVRLEKRYTHVGGGMYVRFGYDPSPKNASRIRTGTDQNGNTWEMNGRQIKQKIRLQNRYTEVEKGVWVRYGADPSSPKALVSGTDLNGNVWEFRSSETRISGRSKPVRIAWHTMTRRMENKLEEVRPGRWVRMGTDPRDPASPRSGTDQLGHTWEDATTGYSMTRALDDKLVQAENGQWIRGSYNPQRQANAQGEPGPNIIEGADFDGNLYTFDAHGQPHKTKTATGWEVSPTGERVMTYRAVTREAGQTRGRAIGTLNKDTVVAREMTTADGSTWTEDASAPRGWKCTIQGGPYALVNGQHLRQTREFHDPDSPWRVTDWQGNTYKRDGDNGLFTLEKEAAPANSVVNGEVVVKTREVRPRSSTGDTPPWSYTLMSGETYTQQESCEDPGRGGAGYYLSGVAAYATVAVLEASEKDGKVRPTGRTVTILMNKAVNAQGEAEAWTGTHEGRIYSQANQQMEGDNVTQVVQTGHQKYEKMEFKDGSRTTVLITYDNTAAKSDRGGTFTLGDQVFKETFRGSGEFKQDSRQEYQTLELQDEHGYSTGQRATILMTKSESFGSEWTGTFRGMQYQLHKGGARAQGTVSKHLEFISIGGEKLLAVVTRTGENTTLVVNGEAHQMGTNARIVPMDGKITLIDDQGRIKTLNSRGIENSAYYMRVSNALNGAWAKVTSLWNKAVRDANATFWKDVKYTLSLIGTSLTAAVEVLLSPATARLYGWADAAKANGSAFWYATCKFVADNAVLLAAMAAGPYGMLLIAASYLEGVAEHGIFGAVLTTAYHFFVAPVLQLMEAIPNAINAWSNPDSFAFADAVVSVMSIAVMAAFGLKQLRHIYKSAKVYVKLGAIILKEAIRAFDSSGIKGALRALRTVMPEMRCNEARAANERVHSNPKLSLAQRLKLSLELSKCENGKAVAEVMGKAGMKAPTRAEVEAVKAASSIPRTTLRTRLANNFLSSMLKKTFMEKPAGRTGIRARLGHIARNLSPSGLARNALRSITGRRASISESRSLKNVGGLRPGQRTSVSRAEAALNQARANFHGARTFFGQVRAANGMNAAIANYAGLLGSLEAQAAAKILSNMAETFMGDAANILGNMARSGAMVKGGGQQVQQVLDLLSAGEGTGTVLVNTTARNLAGDAKTAAAVLNGDHCSRALARAVVNAAMSAGSAQAKSFISELGRTKQGMQNAMQNAGRADFGKMWNTALASARSVFSQRPLRKMADCAGRDQGLMEKTVESMKGDAKSTARARLVEIAASRGSNRTFGQLMSALGKDSKALGEFIKTASSSRKTMERMIRELTADSTNRAAFAEAYKQFPLEAKNTVRDMVANDPLQSGLDILQSLFNEGRQEVSQKVADLLGADTPRGKEFARKVNELNKPKAREGLSESRAEQAGTPVQRLQGEAPQGKDFQYSSESSGAGPAEGTGEGGGQEVQNTGQPQAGEGRTITPKAGSGAEGERLAPASTSAAVTHQSGRPAEGAKAGQQEGRYFDELNQVRQAGSEGISPEVARAITEGRVSEAMVQQARGRMNEALRQDGSGRPAETGPFDSLNQAKQAGAESISPKTARTLAEARPGKSVQEAVETLAQAAREGRSASEKTGASGENLGTESGGRFQSIKNAVSHPVETALNASRSLAYKAADMAQHARENPIDFAIEAGEFAMGGFVFKAFGLGLSLTRKGMGKLDPLIRTQGQKITQRLRMRESGFEKNYLKNEQRLAEADRQLEAASLDLHAHATGNRLFSFLPQYRYQRALQKISTMEHRKTLFEAKGANIRQTATETSQSVNAAELQDTCGKLGEAGRELSGKVAEFQKAQAEFERLTAGEGQGQKTAPDTLGAAMAVNRSFRSLNQALAKLRKQGLAAETAQQVVESMDAKIKRAEGIMRAAEARAGQQTAGTQAQPEAVAAEQTSQQQAASRQANLKAEAAELRAAAKALQEGPAAVQKYLGQLQARLTEIQKRSIPIAEKAGNTNRWLNLQMQARRLQGLISELNGLKQKGDAKAQETEIAAKAKGLNVRLARVQARLENTESGPQTKATPARTPASAAETMIQQQLNLAKALGQEGRLAEQLLANNGPAELIGRLLSGMPAAQQAQLLKTAKQKGRAAEIINTLSSSVLNNLSQHLSGTELAKFSEILTGEALNTRRALRQSTERMQKVQKRLDALEKTLLPEALRSGKTEQAGNLRKEIQALKELQRAFTRTGVNGGPMSAAELKPIQERIAKMLSALEGEAAAATPAGRQSVVRQRQILQETMKVLSEVEPSQLRKNEMQLLDKLANLVEGRSMPELTGEARPEVLRDSTSRLGNLASNMWGRLSLFGEQLRLAIGAELRLMTPKYGMAYEGVTYASYQLAAFPVRMGRAMVNASRNYSRLRRGAEADRGLLNSGQYRAALASTSSAGLRAAMELTQKKVVSKSLYKRILEFQKFLENEGKGKALDQALAEFNAKRETGKLDLERLGIKNAAELGQVVNASEYKQLRKTAEAQLRGQQLQAQLEQAKAEGRTDRIKDLQREMKKVMKSLNMAVSAENIQYRQNLISELRALKADAKLIEQVDLMFNCEAQIQAETIKAKSGSAAKSRQAKQNLAELHGQLAQIIKGIQGSPEFNAILRAEGVKAPLLAPEVVTGEPFKNMLVEMMKAYRQLLKNNAKSNNINQMFEKMFDKAGIIPGKSESRAIIKELLKAFHADPKYQNYEALPDQMAFLVRVTELHLINFELGTKPNSLARHVLGEAILLGMGGGKSAGVLPLDLARRIYEARTGKPAGPSMYITKTDALVQQIMDEPTMKQLKEKGELVEVNDSTLPEILSRGLENGKLYVMSNEGVKKIVLEMRGKGWADARIQEFFSKVSTKAWDECHSILHTTDTILGSSGVWEHLAPSVQAELTGVIEVMFKTHLQVYHALQTDLARNPDARSAMFKDVSYKPGEAQRNQKAFNLDYRIQYGEYANKTLRQAFAEMGVDVRSGGTANMLRKVGQAIYNVNGREYTGAWDSVNNKPKYGTAEGGVGRDNTIYGDSILSGYQLMQITIDHLVGKSQGRIAGRGEGRSFFNAKSFNVAKFMENNPNFTKAVGEALAHVTTERVTMLEAVELMGSHNIIGYTGTITGLSRAMEVMGKRIVEITSEPTLTMDHVNKGELHMSARWGDMIISLDGSGGQARLSRADNRSFQEHIIQSAHEKMHASDPRAQHTQQILTHNDNNVMRKMAIEMARREGVSVLEITDKIAREHFEKMSPARQAELVKELKIQRKNPGQKIDAKAEADLVLQVAVFDMLNPARGLRTGPPQVILIDGMSPQAYTVALDAVKSAIQQAPKNLAQVMQTKKLSSDVRRAIDAYAEKTGKAPDKISLNEFLDAMWKENSRIVEQLYENVKGQLGWTQSRYIFAPAIGEGLNIWGTEKFTGFMEPLDAKGVPLRPSMPYMAFKGHMVKMDLSPTDVFAQAMKRGNVYTEVNGKRVYQRVAAETGLDFNLNEINNLRDVDRARFEKFFKDVADGTLDINSEVARTEFFRIFDGVMREFLKEIDVQKKDAVLRTKAGDIEQTEAVTVAKSSPEYMKVMASRVTQDLPNRLREFQGLQDVAARWHGQKTSAPLLQHSVTRRAMKVGGVRGLLYAMPVKQDWKAQVPGAMWAAGWMQARLQGGALQGAVRAEHDRISGIQGHEDVYQNSDTLARADQVAEYQAKYGANWQAVAFLAERNVGVEQIAQYQKQYGTDWLQAAIADQLGELAVQQFKFEAGDAAKNWVPLALAAAERMGIQVEVGANESPETTAQKLVHAFGQQARDTYQRTFKNQPWVAQATAHLLQNNTGIKRNLDVAQEIVDLRQKHGGEWFNVLMNGRFGSDWQFYQQAGKAAGSPFGLQLGWMIYRQAARHRNQYYETVRNIIQLAEVVPRLSNIPEGAVNYGGQTMTREQGRAYISQQLGKAADLAQKYGIRQVGAFARAQSVPDLAGLAEIARAAQLQLQQQRAGARMAQWSSQQLGNGLRWVQQNQFGKVFFKVEDGWIVPAKKTTLIVGALLLAACASTGLWLFPALAVTTKMMVGVGMVMAYFSSLGVMNKQGKQQAAAALAAGLKPGAANPKAAKWMNGLNLAMSFGYGIFNHPMLISASYQLLMKGFQSLLKVELADSKQAVAVDKNGRVVEADDSKRMASYRQDLREHSRKYLLAQRVLNGESRAEKEFDALVPAPEDKGPSGLMEYFTPAAQYLFSKPESAQAAREYVTALQSFERLLEHYEAQNVYFDPKVRAELRAAVAKKANGVYQNAAELQKIISEVLEEKGLVNMAKAWERENAGTDQERRQLVMLRMQQENKKQELAARLQDAKLTPDERKQLVDQQAALANEEKKLQDQRELLEDRSKMLASFKPLIQELELLLYPDEVPVFGSASIISVSGSSFGPDTEQVLTWNVGIDSLMREADKAGKVLGLGVVATTFGELRSTGRVMQPADAAVDALQHIRSLSGEKPVEVFFQRQPGKGFYFGPQQVAELTADIARQHREKAALETRDQAGREMKEVLQALGVQQEAEYMSWLKAQTKPLTDEMLVQGLAGFKPAPAVQPPAGMHEARPEEQGGQAVIKAKPTLAQRFAQGMGTDRDDAKAAELMAGLLQEEGISFLAAAEAKRYGFMKVLAEVLSLAPDMLGALRSIELGSQEDVNELGEDGRTRILVDRDSLQYFGDTYAEVLINQVVQAVKTRLMQRLTASMPAMENILEFKLRQKGSAFREYGRFAITELCKQFILNAAQLQRTIQDAAEAGETWAQMAMPNKPAMNLFEFLHTEVFGRTFSPEDVSGLQSALEELENSALPVMRSRAAAIEKLKGGDRAVAVAAFQEEFHLAYESYQESANPHLLQRLLVRLAGRGTFQLPRPAARIRGYAFRVFGIGAAFFGLAFIAGMAVIGPIAIVLAGVGAVVMVAGAQMWSMAPRMARQLNPQEYVREAMHAAGFGFKDQETEDAVNGQGLGTLQLFDRLEFTRPVAGLKRSATSVMISESMQNKAICAVLEQMNRVMQSGLETPVKQQLVRELAQVLRFFNLHLEVEIQDQELVILAPKKAALLHIATQNQSFWRLLQNLDKMPGVRLEMPIPAPRMLKLKYVGTSA
ncbi:hypothetical protein JW933_07300 [candidate division FCPU426 bacterium]|nr:hypothetical protein [candidate division FCPU426 bacterium]